MGNACGRRRDVAGGEPHDLGADNLAAAELTGAGIAFGASLERATCVMQHFAVEDVVEVGPVVVQSRARRRSSRESSCPGNRDRLDAGD